MNSLPLVMVFYLFFLAEVGSTMDAKRKLDKKKAIKAGTKKKQAALGGASSSSIVDVVDAGAIVKSLGDHINTRMKELDFDEDLDGELFEERGRALREEAAEQLGNAQRDLKPVATKLLSLEQQCSAGGKANSFFVGHNRNSITCSTQIDQLLLYSDKSGATYCYELDTHNKHFLVPSLNCAVLSIAVSDTRMARHNTAALERSTVDHSCPSYTAVGGADGQIHIWKTFTREYMGALKLHRTGVTGLAFRSATSTLYSCSEDTTVRVWAVAEMLAVDRLFGHTDSVLAIAALRKDRAATGGMDRSTRYWKMEAGSQVEYAPQNAPVECVTFLNDDTIVCGSGDGTLAVYNIGKLKPVCSVTNAHGVGDSGDGSGLERDALLADVEARRTVTGLQIGNPIYAVAAPANGNIIATGSHDGQVRLWHFSSQMDASKKGKGSVAVASELPHHSGQTLVLLGSLRADGIINSLSFSADGQRLAIACSKEQRLGRWVTKSACLNGIRVFTTNAAVADPAALARTSSSFAPRNVGRQKPAAVEPAAQSDGEIPQDADSEEEPDYALSDDGLPNDDSMFSVGENGQLLFTAKSTLSEGKPSTNSKSKKHAKPNSAAPKAMRKGIMKSKKKSASAVSSAGKNLKHKVRRAKE